MALLSCTLIYYRRFRRGHEEPGKGKWVDREGAIVTRATVPERFRGLKKRERPAPFVSIARVTPLPSVRRLAQTPGLH